MAKKKSNSTSATGTASGTATTSSGKAAAKAAKKAKAAAKVLRKETKKAKAENNTGKSGKGSGKGKGKGKAKDEESDDDDLEGILEKMRREWEEAHTVTEETAEGPPSQRANATFTPCPIGNHLWCIGGEYFSDDGKAHFYNDVYRYSPEKDEWRKFTSPICPGPRSAHAVVASAASGGKLFLFGGEFSSLYQNSFHHYRDFWVFDIQTHLWDRIETKLRPTGRSGHRMIMWKHYIVLFGGFIDPGVRTNYLQDLWVFDTQEYKWQQVEFGPNDRRPSPRSGFSFLPVPEGAVLHGGYCKEYVKGKRPQGIALDDTWLLKMDLDLKLVKWEKRKKIGYAPSVRSGCTMALWSAKGIGVLFGGVYDDDKDEETLESVFYNDMYGYQVAGNGRWISLALKKPKKKAPGGKRAKKATEFTVSATPQDTEPIEGDDQDGEFQGNEEGDDEVPPMSPSTIQSPRSPSAPTTRTTTPAVIQSKPDVDPDDPNLTLPLVRYNSMLAVLKNTLYIYGGIYERGAREYTLDDFYLLNLEKLDKFVCLKESRIVPEEGADDESDEDDEEDDEDDEEEDEDEDEEGRSDDDGDSDEEGEGKDESGDVVEVSASGAQDAEDEEDRSTDVRLKAQALLQQTQQLPRSQNSSAKQQPSRPSAPETTSIGESGDTDDAHVTPLPGETLATFYARTKDHWAAKVLQQGIENASTGGSESKAKGKQAAKQGGKQLRRDGFALAEERWEEYKPVLKEVERILEESGASGDKDGGVVVGGSGKGGGVGVDSRNRR